MTLAFAVTFLTDNIVKKAVVLNTFQEVVEIVKKGKAQLHSNSITTTEWRCDSVVLMDRLSKGEVVKLSRIEGGKYAIQVDVQQV